MASITKVMSKDEIDALYKRTKPIAIKESEPPYAWWGLKTQECMITAYKSGKVLFQGNDLSWLEEEDNSAKSKKSSASQKHPSSKSASSSYKTGYLKGPFPQAGSDECGTGDYFGPLVVASVIVENEETARKLMDLGITDSKAMTDPKIRVAAPEVKKLVPYSLLILTPAHYNRIYDQENKNQNRLKAKMHNQAYLNLIQKGFTLPDFQIVDQFCVPATYYRHLSDSSDVVRTLHFETKAESKYISVAAASVIARNALLETFDQMEKKFDFQFPKGGGADSTNAARAFMKDHSVEDLSHVAKLHFSNTEKVLGYSLKDNQQSSLF